MYKQLYNYALHYIRLNIKETNLHLPLVNIAILQNSPHFEILYMWLP